MGSPKPFLPFAGKTLIEHRLDSFRAMFSQVLLVTNDPAPFAHLNAEVTSDELPEGGPLAGILTALRSARHDRTMIIACDMPLVTGECILNMISHWAECDAMVLSHAGGTEPLLGIYSRSCIGPLEQFLSTGAFKVIDFLSTINLQRFQYDDNETAGGNLPLFFNVNSPDDYSRLTAGGNKPV